MIIYHSQEFGNTEACAHLITEGIDSVGGIDVEMINTNVAQRVDMNALSACDGVAIGSPDYASYVAGTIKQLFDDMYVAAKTGLVFRGKPCVLFMTHGGGGAAIKPFRSMARSFRLVAEPYVCQGAPAKCCPEAVELGRALAKAVEGGARTCSATTMRATQRSRRSTR